MSAPFVPDAATIRWIVELLHKEIVTLREQANDRLYGAETLRDFVNRLVTLENDLILSNSRNKTENEK